jgi:hypothetical protein
MHMHIAGACIFEDPPPAIEEIAGLIASKLHLIPRYNGTLFFGVTGDFETMPDVGVLAEAVPHDIEDLRKRAQKQLGKGLPKR